MSDEWYDEDTLREMVPELEAELAAARSALAEERCRFETADSQVFDQIRQRHDAAASLAVVEEALVARCQHATEDNADLRGALLELRIVRDQLDPRGATQ